VQEGVAWWEASADWSPAVVPLPEQLVTPAGKPSAASWSGRLWRAWGREIPSAQAEG
jgi:hypothetical protein